MKISHLLAAALLTAFVLPPILRADTEVVDGIEWTYTVLGGKVSVGSGAYPDPAIPTSTSGILVIPAILGGYPVTSIGNYAFYGCSGFTSVTIPDSVTSIGDEAFEGCSGLTSVTIPDSVTSIGNRVFYRCTGISEVVISGRIAIINGGAFEGCSGLKSVTIEEGVTSIESYAFNGCRNLATVNIPKSIKRFGNNAFGSCGNITNVIIAQQLQLKSIFSSAYKSITSAVMEEGMTIIGYHMFAGCEGLTSVTIPDSVLCIDQYAFEGCRSLANVTIPNGVTSIEQYAFSGCENLTSVAIPDSVSSIGDGAFASCIRLTSVSLGKGLANVGLSVFSNCLSLNSVEIFCDIVNLSGNGFNGFGFSGVESVTFGDNIEIIPGNMFYGWGRLSSVTLGNGVKSIGNYAFSNCDSLNSFMIPGNVASIGKGAFSGCRSLTSITISDGVTDMGDEVFQFCNGLTSMMIPKSMTSIGRNAFSNCFSLKHLYLPSLFEGNTAGMGIAQGCEVAFYSGETPPLSTVYRVSFNANLGSGTMALWAFAFDETANLPANKFSRFNYVFSGWAKAANGPVSYADGAAVSKLAMPGESVTLYAQWAVEEHDVTFNANGGEGGMTNTIAVGVEIVAPNVTLEGHTFAGWVPIVPATMPASNVTFIAQWTPTGISDSSAGGSAVNLSSTIVATYKVAFNANDGKGKMAAQTFSYGKAAKLRKNTFTRSGYVFIGWAKSKSGSVAYKNAQSVKNLRADGKTTTLYAVWAKKTYKVAFYGTYKGVKGKMAVESFTYGKAKKLSANKFKRKGYTFKGWAKSKALAKKGKVAYRNKQAVKNLVTNGKTVKLYAVWKKK